jgi:VWFA-related protein
MSGLSRLSIAGATLAACMYGAPGRPFVDCTQEELTKAVPELSTLAFDDDQTPLNSLLSAAGEQVQNMVAKFVNVSMAEQIHEARFDIAHLAWKDHRDRFRYVVVTNPFSESRRQAQGPDAPSPDAKTPFLIAGPFVDVLGDLLPENQAQSRFRYLGRITEDGKPSLLVAFLARDSAREGLVWLDEPTKRILRLRVDALDHPDGGRLDTFTRDVRFVPVDFPALKTILWLPASAIVDARFSTGELHSVHRFSDYRAEPADAIGTPAEPIGMEDDAVEVLLRGLAALAAAKPADALAPLREAASRLPNRIEPGYYLGLALYETHDWAGAETQFRETVKRSPGLAIAHDGLGMVLLKRGDQPGAVAELQEALRLEPGNEKIRANLEAAAKAPGVQIPASGTTIKVNVRQVLVPVVVTDKQGHHVTGLTQADFQVFEDGVEQKITAFSSERAEALAPKGVGSAPGPHAAPAAPPTPLPLRHIYVICLDTVHNSFGSSVYVRQALQKLFQQETAGDSRYALIALGTSLEVIRDVTSDPAKVLEALGTADFSNLFARSPKVAAQVEVSSYETELQRVRMLCDSLDPECPARKRALPLLANSLAEDERLRTTQFLAQFRSVVEQLARDSGRRTMILISDGLLLVPGRIPYGLLETYFPEFRSPAKLDRITDAMEPILRLAARSDVAIYTINSRGLSTPLAGDASVANQMNREWSDIAADEQLTLADIAAATGGIAFQNSNDLFTGLQRAFADGREYYTLAYVSTNEAQDGKFRKIEVRVHDKGALVNAKRGYWATSQ